MEKPLGWPGASFSTDQCFRKILIGSAQYMKTRDIQEIIQRMIEACGVKNAAQMAKIAGFSSGAVSQWKNRKNVTDKCIAKVALITGTSYDWLKSGRGRKSGPPLQDPKPLATQVQLFERELQLINAFRQLDERAQDEVFDNISKLAIDAITDQK